MLEYRYPHFTRNLILQDMSFRGGPEPGEPMPDFELPTVDGRTIRKSDFVGRRPVLFILGSITCPMTAAARDVLKRLHQELGDRVELVTLYVREAHPGDRYAQARDLTQKLEYARAYQERDEIPWTVAVDDVEGRLHRALDLKPNAAYVMAADGTVAHRILWSNDQRALRKALRAAIESPRVVGQTESRLIPMLGDIGRMYETLEASGRTATRDVLRLAPPMYALARVAALFRPLPPVARGLAAMAIAIAGVMAAGAAIKQIRGA